MSAGSQLSDVSAMLGAQQKLTRKGGRGGHPALPPGPAACHAAFGALEGPHAGPGGPRPARIACPALERAAALGSGDVPGARVAWGGACLPHPCAGMEIDGHPLGSCATAVLCHLCIINGSLLLHRVRGRVGRGRVGSVAYPPGFREWHRMSVRKVGEASS